MKYTEDEVVGLMISATGVLCRILGYTNLDAFDKSEEAIKRTMKDMKDESSIVYALVKGASRRQGEAPARQPGLKLDQEAVCSFQEVVRPVIKWLNDNCHPHTHIVITPVSAELSEGVATTGTIMDYVKD